MSGEPIELRMSRPGDADAILAFIAAMGFTPRDRVTWDGLGMIAPLATRGTEIVGAIPIELRPVKIAPNLAVQWAHQTCVAVHPDLRGDGVGTRLQALLRSSLPDGTQMMGVYREDPDSPAYKWYLRNGFRKAMTIVSWTTEISETKIDSPLIPSPPPEGETPGATREGTRVAHAWRRARTDGCFVDQSQRALHKWLDVHPYRLRYRFEIIGNDDAYALLGIGALHSNSNRADVLDFVADETSAENLLDRCIVRARELGASPLRWAMVERDPNVRLARSRGMSPGWTFDLLIHETTPGLHVDASNWRYASIDFA